MLSCSSSIAVVARQADMFSLVGFNARDRGTNGEETRQWKMVQAARHLVKGVTPRFNGESLYQFQIVALEGWARGGSGVFPFPFLDVVHHQSTAFSML
jgi:hypothetical protein